MKHSYFLREKANPVRCKFHNSELNIPSEQKTNGLKTFCKANVRFAIFKQLLFKRIISKEFKY